MGRNKGEKVAFVNFCTFFVSISTFFTHANRNKHHDVWWLGAAIPNCFLNFLLLMLFWIQK